MIYFVRHGLSEANVRGIFAGKKENSPLVEEGRHQAKEVAQKIIEDVIKVDKIVSSPSARAIETAQIIAEELGYDVSDIIIDDRINEYDMGSLTGTPWSAIPTSTFIKLDDSEEIEDFYNRVFSCLKDFSQITGNILMVSHGAVGRMLETIRLNKDIKLFYETPIYKNASITKIDWIK